MSRKTTVACAAPSSSPPPPPAPAALCARLSPWELRMVRADALREYGLLLNRLAAEELARAESLARADLEADAAALLSALASLRRDGTAGEAARSAARRLDERLTDRAAALQRRADAREAELREDGRTAWRAEVAESERRRQASAERREAERRAARTLRAACVFIAAAETRARAELRAEEAAALAQLNADGEEGRVEAERLAHERFLATPEQVLLREEREKREAAAARTAARQLRRFVAEQKNFVTACTHGRGRTSMFEGPQAKRLCVACAVKFDSTLGYFVRMRGKTIKPPEGAPLPTPTFGVLPPMKQRESDASSVIGKKKKRNITG